MGGISLLAASVVVALLGFGWINAIKSGVFDVWAFITGQKTEEVDEVMEDKDGDVMNEKDDSESMMEKDDADELDIEATIEVDPEFDEELNDLEKELDALLNESDAELDALEEEI